MKKTLISALIVGLLPTVALAAPGTDPLADQYFSKNEPKMTPQELAAVAIGKKWQEGQDVKPFQGADGSINWPFLPGKQYPVMCAVLQVCDVALQPGENVNGLNVGDPRYTVEPAVTGSGSSQVIHLILKPLDVGLDTTLVLTTDRRTYHFRLRSSRTQLMPFVSFTYPETAMAKWDAIKARETQVRQENTIPQTGEYLGNLNFNYSVDGSARWKPVRVYNDGRKTIIEMPSTMQQSAAPALLVVRKDGGLFTDAETQMVNYRVQGDRYIVDSIFDKAILVSGVGSSQDKVTITRGN
ncbi:P-type conjugative transfer protein TrbG [Xanthomonas citri pv. citri]|nr:MULTISPECIES: P-type conjugative transfer protein TrbG [Xanthomonas]MBD1524590.1 P-type conjugative transfer protein TrbG [Xanthomonas citri pv. citri]KEZ98457.1 conjugal transfer protein TrbG [Xanthomonas vasicola pv. vasculorum NCPPB 895]MDO6936089.1 P-type conjugative transfer protein TrbG [Xanthomonas vasicola]MDO6939974.1 P-type conjugative transfer protein TrbG [Xanthomonas vasicola]UEQ17595.1 P-type conjugative transfer protein TrbG [Xanthomonas phaseoli pv. manihotis]